MDDLIDLVGAVDGILQAQSAADAESFLAIAGRRSLSDRRPPPSALHLSRGD